MWKQLEKKWSFLVRTLWTAESYMYFWPLLIAFSRLCSPIKHAQTRQNFLPGFWEVYDCIFLLMKALIAFERKIEEFECENNLKKVFVLSKDSVNRWKLYLFLTIIARLFATMQPSKTCANAPKFFAWLLRSVQM